jgi:hypothetical protein
VAAFLARSEDRVGKEEEAAMNKSAKSEDGRKAAGAGQLWLRLPGLVREALYDTVIGAGLVIRRNAREISDDGRQERRATRTKSARERIEGTTHKSHLFG